MNDIKLIRKAKRGDIKSQNALIENNMGLIVNAANSLGVMNYKNIEIKDLINIGVISAISAVKTFNLKHGASFSTYLYYKAKLDMLDHIRRFSRPLYIPYYYYKTKNKNIEILRNDIFETLESRGKNPYRECKDRERRSIINNYINGTAISDFERDILKLKFWHKKTQGEMAKILYVSRAKIIRTEHKIYSKMRKLF